MTVIEGIALEPTRDVGGTDWTEDALRDAADSLAGSPIVEEFGADPDQIGVVTDSEYRDDEGVWFRAELDTDIDHGHVSMAPALTFGAPVETADGSLSVEGIQFESMAPVAEATAAVGEHEVVDDGSE